MNKNNDTMQEQERVIKVAILEQFITKTLNNEIGWKQQIIDYRPGHSSKSISYYATVGGASVRVRAGNESYVTDPTKKLSPIPLSGVQDVTINDSVVISVNDFKDYYVTDPVKALINAIMRPDVEADTLVQIAPLEKYLEKLKTSGSSNCNKGFEELMDAFADVEQHDRGVTDIIVDEKLWPFFMKSILEHTDFNDVNISFGKPPTPHEMEMGIVAWVSGAKVWTMKDVPRVKAYNYFDRDMPDEILGKVDKLSI